MLLRLAGNTSQRETLEVLCNLPGIKEPNGERREAVLLPVLSPPVNYSVMFCGWHGSGFRPSGYLLSIPTSRECRGVLERDTEPLIAPNAVVASLTRQHCKVQ